MAVKRDNFLGGDFFLLREAGIPGKDQAGGENQGQKSFASLVHVGVPSKEL
jgi:hypothetical protein